MLEEYERKKNEEKEVNMVLNLYKEKRIGY